MELHGSLCLAILEGPEPFVDLRTAAFPSFFIRAKASSDLPALTRAMNCSRSGAYTAYSSVYALKSLLPRLRVHAHTELLHRLFEGRDVRLDGLECSCTIFRCLRKNENEEAGACVLWNASLASAMYVSGTVLSSYSSLSEFTIWSCS